MVKDVGEGRGVAGCAEQIRQYRPWYDGTFRDLAILRQLSLAFPEDGAVTAKTIEIHDGNMVTLLRHGARLRGAAGDAGKIAHGGRRERFEAGTDSRQSADAIRV